MKKKLLIYSDCFTYSGSENIIENILNSKSINERYEVSFFYAFNKQYDDKVKIRLAEFYRKEAKPLYILTEVSIRNKWAEQEKDSIIYYCYYFLFILSYILRLSGFFSLVNFFLFKRLFIKQKPDVLLINNGGYPGALSCRIAATATKNMKIKNVIFVVNNMALPARNFLDSELDKYVAQCVKYFVTASEAAKLELIKVRHFSSSKCINIPNTLYNEQSIYTIPNGTLRKKYNIIDENTTILGSVGLLTKRKGYHILIEAINILSKNAISLNFVCFIIGEGEERNNLEKLISKYNLSDKIRLIGFQNDVLKYVADFDVFILPSTHNEDFPYVIIEAMAIGKPVIGSRVAGIPEQIVENETGYVVTPNDANELSQKINFLLTNPQMLCMMGQNAKKKYMHSFSYEKIISLYLNTING